MFKHRIAHGMLTAGLVSAVLGTKCSTYMEQDLAFTAPVYFGDTITVFADIIKLIPEKIE